MIFLCKLGSYFLIKTLLSNRTHSFLVTLMFLLSNRMLLLSIMRPCAYLVLVSATLNVRTCSLFSKNINRNKFTTHQQCNIWQHKCVILLITHGQVFAPNQRMLWSCRQCSIVIKNDFVMF